MPVNHERISALQTDAQLTFWELKVLAAPDTEYLEFRAVADGCRTVAMSQIYFMAVPNSKSLSMQMTEGATHFLG